MNFKRGYLSLISVFFFGLSLCAQEQKKYVGTFTNDRERVEACAMRYFQMAWKVLYQQESSSRSVSAEKLELLKRAGVIFEQQIPLILEECNYFQGSISEDKVRLILNKYLCKLCKNLNLRCSAGAESDQELQEMMLEENFKRLESFSLKPDQLFFKRWWTSFCEVYDGSLFAAHILPYSLYVISACLGIGVGVFVSVIFSERMSNINRRYNYGSDDHEAKWWKCFFEAAFAVPVSTVGVGGVGWMVGGFFKEKHGRFYREKAELKKNLQKIEEADRIFTKRLRKEQATTFDMIWGCTDVKKTLLLVADQLKYPVRYFGTLPKGVLLYGVPGTGKTSLIAAVARHAGCPLLNVTPRDLLTQEEFQLKRLLDLASKAAMSGNHLSVMIVIDDIDCFTVDRKKQALSSDQRTEALHKLLGLLDGIEKNNPYINLIFFAATNHFEDLDEALIRSGRFDIIAEVKAPTKAERVEGFRNLLHEQIMPYIPLGAWHKGEVIKTIMSKEECYQWLGDISEGLNMTYADMKSYIRQAKAYARRDNRSTLNQHDFIGAFASPKKKSTPAIKG